MDPKWTSVPISQEKLDILTFMLNLLIFKALLNLIFDSDILTRFKELKMKMAWLEWLSG